MNEALIKGMAHLLEAEIPKDRAEEGNSGRDNSRKKVRICFEKLVIEPSGIFLGWVGECPSDQWAGHLRSKVNCDNDGQASSPDNGTNGPAKSIDRESNGLICGVGDLAKDAMDDSDISCRKAGCARSFTLQWTEIVNDCAHPRTWRQ